MTPKHDGSKTSFWRRWIWPRLPALTIRDWTMWTAVVLGMAVALWPILSPFHLRRSITVESLGSTVISFAAIGLGIALALAALVVTFPSGKLRKVMQEPDLNGGPTPYSDLAFVAFWAGFANLLAATVALTASVIAGPYRIMRDENVLPAVASGLIVCVTVYALLQMLHALIALLEAAGLSEKFSSFRNN